MHGPFRVVPEQNYRYPFLVEYLAEYSLREVEGGWTWKFDPGRFHKLQVDAGDGPDRAEKLLQLACPCAFIVAETSEDYTPESREYTKQICGGKMPMFEIPGTFHHLMFDDPVAVSMAIKSTLLAWHHR